MSTKFTVDYDSYTHTTREPYPDDDWDRGDTHTDVSINGVVMCDSDKYFDLVLPGDYDPSKPLYLLWASYDTGDSFGRDGGKAEFIDLFQDHERAQAALKVLQQATDDSFEGSYIRDDGTPIKIYVPWVGYFESLNYITVESVYVRNPS